MANCPYNCVYTNLCTAATCTNDTHCAAGYYCPEPGSVGTGGGPNVAFCGDLLCSPGESVETCGVDCDPNYRRCSAGIRGCQTNLDCGPGYVCEFYGGTGGSGQGGASGSAGSVGVGGTIAVGGTGSGEAGAPAGGAGDAEAATGGRAGAATGGIAGSGGTGVGGGGTSGTGVGGGAGTGVAGGGTGGLVGECVPGGSGGPTGGTSGVGGTTYGGTGTGAQGGSYAGTAGTDRGGSGGDGGSSGINGDDESDTVVTHGGCSMSNGSDTSSLAGLLIAALALLRAGRRRASKRAR